MKQGRRRLVGCLALLCLLVGLLPGCRAKTGAPQIEYVIGVSQANMQDAWRILLMEELRQEASGYPNISLVVADAIDDSGKQALDIQRLLDFGIDLLVVSPCDGFALTPVVSEAYQNIPVVVMDRAVEGLDYSLFIGPDNSLTGKLAAQAVLRLSENLYGNTSEARVLELYSDVNPAARTERTESFAAELLRQDAHLAVKRLALRDGLRDTAEDTLLLYEHMLADTDIIFAHSDDIALGAYRALEKLGLHYNIRIISIDGYAGENGGLDMVKRGILAQTISCPTGGREAVRYALDILNEVSGVPKQVILRSHSIGAANVEAYETSLATQPVAAEGTIRVGYAQVGTESSWRIANNASIAKAAKDFGIQLTIIDADQDLDRQIAALRTFIADGVDVIVLTPVVDTGWDEVMREAGEAGIPVLLSDRNIELQEESSTTSFIGADFIEEGSRAMRWILDNVAIGPRGAVHILELQGTFGATPTYGRKTGFEQLLATSPGYEIVHSAGGDFTIEGGREVVEDYIAATGGFDIDVIFSHNDDMAVGAIAALEAAGYKPGEDVKIVSVDGTAAALEAIVAGKLNCSVECSPLLGPEIMKAITDLMSGKELPLRIITDETVFTKENAGRELPGRQY